MSLQNSQFYGANFSYLLHRFDYFVASMQRLGVRTIEFYAAAPHLYLEDASTDDVRRIARMLRAAGIQVGRAVPVSHQPCLRGRNAAKPLACVL